MTNSEYVNKYRITAGHIFAMFNNANCGVNRINSPIYPVTQANNFEMQGISSHASSFIFVTGTERTDFTAGSALSLPWISRWKGIRHKIIVLPVSVRCV